jgi:hypothetical protein
VGITVRWVYSVGGITARSNIASGAFDFALRTACFRPARRPRPGFPSQFLLGYADNFNNFEIIFAKL